MVLSLNELSGPIPSELANLASLEVLGLANNKLSGAIPAGLANLASLQALYLAANQLSGPIPPSLGNLSNLQFMRLAGNPELTGCVPRNLRRLLVSPVSGRVTHDFIEVDGNRDGNVDDALRGDVAGLGLPFCMLRNLQLGGATLDPPFVAENPTYVASLHSGATAVVVTATLIDEHARVGIRKGGRSYANGEPVPLDPGLNTITIDIAPLDATPWQTFSVEVTRPPGPISWLLREGSDIVAAPAGVSTTASRLFLRYRCRARLQIQPGNATLGRFLLHCPRRRRLRRGPRRYPLGYWPGRASPSVSTEGLLSALPLPRKSSWCCTGAATWWSCPPAHPRRRRASSPARTWRPSGSTTVERGPGILATAPPTMAAPGSQSSPVTSSGLLPSATLWSVGRHRPKPTNHGWPTRRSR